MISMAKHKLYSKSNCPLDKEWFIWGGRCGWSKECLKCEGMPNLIEPVVIEKDREQITLLAIECLSGVISISQINGCSGTNDVVHLEVETLEIINKLIKNVPFDD